MTWSDALHLQIFAGITSQLQNLRQQQQRLFTQYFVIILTLARHINTLLLYAIIITRKANSQFLLEFSILLFTEKNSGLIR